MKYKNYELKCDGNKYYTFKARPYDDAEYYWAYTYDKKHWAIVYNGRQAMTIESTFERVVDILERHNQNIKPIMCYN